MQAAAAALQPAMQAIAAVDRAALTSPLGAVGSMHVELVIMSVIMAATSMYLALSLAAILGLAKDLAVT
jgi:hypothetical protein